MNHTTTGGLRHEHISPSGNIVFCLGSTGGPFDRKSEEGFDQFMPLTALAALRPGRDVAVVPAGRNEEIIAGFYRQMLNLEPWQVQFAQGQFCALETNVCGDMEQELRGLCSPSSVLLTYNQHEAAEWLSERLGIPLYGDTWVWRKQFGKVALHQHINKRKRNADALDQLQCFRVPRGYVAETTAELIDAFNALKAFGVRAFVLKPAFSDAGQGINYLTLKDDRRLSGYKFELGPVILEEKVELAIDGSVGSPVSPSIHWAGQHIGLPTSQLIEDNEYQGTCYPAQLSDELVDQARSMVKAYVGLAQPQGLGGLDFIGGLDGNLYLCDVNNGRCTEAIPPLLFATQHQPPESVLLARKYVPDCSVWGLWSRLESRRLAWHPQPGERGKGVFPLVHLDEVAGMLVACAPTAVEARELLREALEPI